VHHRDELERETNPDALAADGSHIVPHASAVWGVLNSKRTCKQRARETASRSHNVASIECGSSGKSAATARCSPPIGRLASSDVSSNASSPVNVNAGLNASSAHAIAP
ncbi:MAG: hypothetical protein SGPRY_013759, partial [Prymnesium sp.]